MSTDAGAVAPYSVVPGQVLSPTAVVDALAFPAHDFFNVLRDLLHGSRVYSNETALTAAVETVNQFEKHFLKADHKHVISDTDRAPVEDVSERIPPRAGGAVTVPSGAPAIDYDKLARALMAAGFGQPAPVTTGE